MTNNEAKELVIHIKLGKEATETGSDVRDVLSSLGQFLAAAWRVEPVDIFYQEIRDSYGETIGHCRTDSTYHAPNTII